MDEPLGPERWLTREELEQCLEKQGEILAAAADRIEWLERELVRVAGPDFRCGGQDTDFARQPATSPPGVVENE